MSSDPAPQLPIRQLSPDPAPPPMPRPKLSIAHLMLWTLGTAIALSLSRTQLSFLDRPSGIPGDFSSGGLSTFLRISAIAVAPFHGIAVAVLLVTVGRLYRKGILPLTEPGHWILLITGATILLNALVHVVHSVIFASLGLNVGDMVETLCWQVPQGVIFLLASALYLLAWRSTPQPPRWRFYFLTNVAMMVIAAVLPLVFTILQFAQSDITGFWLSAMVLGLISMPFAIAWLVAFPLAVCRDMWLKSRRDALHWTGIALVVVEVVASVADNFALSMLVD